MREISWLRNLALLVLLSVAASPAGAHPNESSAFGLRSMVRLSEKGLHPLVILEVPLKIALDEFGELYIRTGKVDANNIGQEALDEFNRLQWDRLAQALRVTVNGEVPPGSWKPVETPINGKANEGFFVYMVWYELEDREADLGSMVTVEIENRALEGERVFYSGYADCRSPWKIVENSAEDLLGSDARVKEANQNPGSWTEDDAMRKLRVVYGLSDGSDETVDELTGEGDDAGTAERASPPSSR